MPIHLEPWEINLILNVLGEQPYNKVAATIQRIKDQVDQLERERT